MRLRGIYVERGRRYTLSMLTAISAAENNQLYKGGTKHGKIVQLYTITSCEEKLLHIATSYPY